MTLAFAESWHDSLAWALPYTCNLRRALSSQGVVYKGKAVSCFGKGYKCTLQETDFHLSCAVTIGGQSGS